MKACTQKKLPPFADCPESIKHSIWQFWRVQCLQNDNNVRKLWSALNRGDQDKIQHAIPFRVPSSFTYLSRWLLIAGEKHREIERKRKSEKFDDVKRVFQLNSVCSLFSWRNIVKKSLHSAFLRWNWLMKLHLKYRKYRIRSCFECYSKIKRSERKSF